MTTSNQPWLTKVMGYLVVCALTSCGFVEPSLGQEGVEPKLSKVVPRDIGDLQGGLLPNDHQSQLDHLSWQTFVALNWPANTDLPIGQAQPRVWELYPDPVACFQPDLTFPDLGPGAKALQMTSKKVELIRDPDITDQAAVGKPLLDQYGNHAVYEIRINPVQKTDIIAVSDCSPRRR